MDEIEIIENVPKIKKKNNNMIIIIAALISLLVIVGIILLIVFNKPSNAITVESNEVTTNNKADMVNEALKENFLNEAKTYVSYLESAYVGKSTRQIINVMDDQVEATNDIYNVTINGKYYYYLCMTLDDLVKEQYMTTLSDVKSGYIQMWIPTQEDNAIFYINVSNGKYYYQGDINANLSDSPSSEVDVPSPNVKCPTSAKFHS